MKNTQCANVPDKYTPYTIEIELTNYCNAHCIFCPNNSSKRKRGFIDKQKLYNILNEQEKRKIDNWFNKRFNTLDFPKIVYAGLGEPLLHPDFLEIVEYTKKLGFYVEIVTNGLLLNKNIVDKLIELKVDSLAISLHSINKKIYNEITGLPLKKVLPNVTYALEKYQKYNGKIQLWRIKPLSNMKQETKNDEKMYQEYLKQYPNVIMLGPSEPWERDMDNPTSCKPVNDDPENCIWCRKLYYTLNIAYNGDIVMCCNDFNRISVNMGNIFEKEDTSNIIRNKILQKQLIPPICKKCRRWKDNELEEIFEKYGDKNE